MADIVVSDLSVLRQVAEGWFVEYKSELSPAKTIAKSVTSFANQDGGWIFYGVEEADERKAGAFPGIPKGTERAAIETCRNAMSAHVDPIPYFECVFIDGPSTELNLGDDRGILTIWVPRGHCPPYVHSSGRIYRRVGDASEPIAETSRDALDRLWDRSHAAAERLRDRLLTVPQRSEAESDQSYLHLHIMSDPLEDRQHKARCSLEQFATLMRDPEGLELAFPFDTVFPETTGFVARMANVNRPWMLLPTWTYRRDCSSIVTLPINNGPAGNPHVTAFLHGYKHESRFSNILGTRDYGPARVLDLNLICFWIQFAMMQHRRLAAADSIHGPFKVKAHLEGLWRRIPYLDTSSYVDSLEQNGVPVLQCESALVPPGTTVESMLEIPHRTEHLHSLEESIAESVPIFLPVLNSLGVAGASVLLESKGEFLELVGRAKDVQKQRHELDRM